MGCYNTYDGVQLKVAEDLMLINYKIGDEVDIPDGVYVGYEGIVVIIDGKLVKVFTELYDKYGGTFDLEKIIPNPLNEILEDMIKDRKNKKERES